ncbi:hypothetical protein P3T76_008829 [Phytophthora citrophthora]|uniref:Uncharacterized protein n=1 Tax=Phytophthora citrophthora TaxID=4793 RepID=A0AAD9LKN3_9STRA|nr:hypothetical protein P3T76_008829 [Phytophthora citrophthora]
MLKFVGQFVKAVNDAYTEAANGSVAVPPPPSEIPKSLTRESFKKVILAYAQVRTAGQYDTTFLVCDIPEVTTAVVRLFDLSRHPWARHVIGVGGADNVLPIADVLVLKACTDTLVRAFEPFHTSCGIIENGPFSALV